MNGGAGVTLPAYNLFSIDHWDFNYGELGNYIIQYN